MITDYHCKEKYYMTTEYREFFEVRNSELDAQAIVANHNYMVYLSHTRHKFIESLGINFVEYAKKKQKLVVLSCAMKFINSLGAGDKFYVTCKLQETEYPYQFAYEQEIKLIESNKKILKATFVSTCINEDARPDEDKLYMPEIIKVALQEKEANPV